MNTDREAVAEGKEQRDREAPVAVAAPEIAVVGAAGVGTRRGKAMTPVGLLALQRNAGNRAVTHAIASRRMDLPPGRGVLARNAKTERFAVQTEDLEHLRSTMKQLVQGLDYKTRMTLVGDKTLAIGLVIDDDGEPRLIYTVSQNWINPTLRDQADQLGIGRWEAQPDVKGRGDVGAPGDAEQLMLQIAETNNFRIAAMVVSRPVCSDCSEAIRDYSRGTIEVIVERAVPTEADIAITRKLNAVRDDLTKLRNRLDVAEGEHKAQRDLIDKPSVTGFVGFVVDKANKYPLPDVIIWGNAHGRIEATKREINAANPDAAVREYLRARRAFSIALKRYSASKNGLDAAAAKTKAEIAAVGAAAIAAFVAPAAIAAVWSWITGAGAAAGVAGAATGATAEEQTMIRIAELVGKADQAIAASEAVTEDELMREAEVEAEQEALQTMPPAR